MDYKSEGFKEAKKITREWAKTFYFASLFLPKPKRYAAYAVYAICRMIDHSVDNTQDDTFGQNLHTIELNLQKIYSREPVDTPLLLAFQQTIEEYSIPQKYFDDLIKGMRMDLQKKRYANFNELEEYCYYAAGVIGLIMLKIFLTNNPHAEPYAIDLGKAMQLTNIIRDVKEDYALGRIYLPQEDLIRFQITEDLFRDQVMTDPFRSLLKEQITRAKNFYARAVHGITLIQPLPSRLVVFLMKELYSGILSAVEQNNYDVFSQRAHVPLPNKILLTAKVVLQGKYLKKPR